MKLSIVARRALQMLAFAAFGAVTLLAPAAARSSPPAGHAGQHTAAHAGPHDTSHKASYNAPHNAPHNTSHNGGAKAAPGVARDSHGRIARSAEQKDAFKHDHPCPATGKSAGACPGYTVDHIVPLKRGGADRPANMQWQTTRAAKAKDRTE